ncbi:toxin glutamine deamidase domain-containing protein [Mycolicibacterium litorale]|uniref:Tox-PL domain-containing protein n=1 Tax=Mycolicibacterium litorale TaxID=758802 RepID=A0AAD1IQH0_9MYCO|nr:toxin glutamine deamidase domain-containing protein [Mycolicibacterium litorale]MCV7416522.1 hypothetical protein [Mycolicibacterium litorale]TDY09775.1 papain fold toxin 1 (glutamine deamidase) of polymorphic toxin system [Mycolicibacterium litorale]BBY17722.1 hypothetical protein MLIT_33140 [Mycolicibacterium litorale]
MSPAASAADLPSRSQIEQWSTKHLADGAAQWRAAAASSDDAFDQHRQNIVSPGGTLWEGDAKDAALARVASDIAVVGSQSGVLREAAGRAENGVTDIDAAKREALAAIEAAESDGFEVAEDLSITDTRAYDSDTAAARQIAAAEHAEDIRWAAERLTQADAHVGAHLEAKATELKEMRFDGETDGRDGDPTIRLVDHRTDASGSDADQRGWRDLLLPPETPKDAASGTPAGTDPAEDTAKSPLDEVLVPAKTTDPGQPRNLDEALDEVAGQPAPTAQGPRLDPAKVEEFKATARRLMEQQGVPADQIEQRLNDMVANAQKPLVPYTPPDGPPPPKPGFGEGFGDAWRSAEESVRDLTGRNGWDPLKEAWKNLGGSLAETAMDPYGTTARSVAENAEALQDNPEYWLGGKTFESGAAAATLPFGLEGAAASRLSALDDVARSGIPHEVIDTPRTPHSPASFPAQQEMVPPVAPHTPFAVENQGLPRGSDHPITPTPDGFDYPDAIGPSAPQSISDIQQWLPEINRGPDMDPFDPARAVNCGQCALAVDQRLTGNVPDASAGLGTLSVPEMEAATGLRQEPATPAEIEQYLVSQGPGAHTVVGVDRANGFAGHWFNAYYDGSRVYAVDGQTGQIVGWPPNMDLPNGPVTVWDMGVPK